MLPQVVLFIIIYFQVNKTVVNSKQDSLGVPFFFAMHHF